MTSTHILYFLPPLPLCPQNLYCLTAILYHFLTPSRGLCRHHIWKEYSAGVQQPAFPEYRRLFITPSPLLSLKPASAAWGSIFHLALLSYSSHSFLGTNPLAHHLLLPLYPSSNYAITQISSFLPCLMCRERNQIGVGGCNQPPPISFNLMNEKCEGTVVRIIQMRK